MGAGEFMIGTDIGDGAGGWRAAEGVEEAGCCSGTSQSGRLFFLVQGGQAVARHATHQLGSGLVALGL